MIHFILILIGLLTLNGYAYGNPFSDYLNSKKGITAYNNANYNEAFSYFSTIIDSDKKNGIAYSNLGNIYFKQEEFDAAIGAYNAASQLLQSTDGQFHLSYNQGTVALSQAQYSNAITHLKRALTLNPHHQNAKHNLELAIALSKQNQSNPTPNAQDNDDSSNPNDTPPPESENEPPSQSPDNSQNPSNTPDAQPESDQPSESDKEKASQLLDQLSQLEKEARDRYKKVPPESIVVEFDW